MLDVFLDTDVAFDIISKRTPHFDRSIGLLELAVNGRVTLFISESAIANLIYLSNDIYKIKDSNIKLMDFLMACEIISCGKQKLLEALQSSFKDKEDAIQYYTALSRGVDYFITRNVKDYKNALRSLPVLTPSDFYDII